MFKVFWRFPQTKLKQKKFLHFYFPEILKESLSFRDRKMKNIEQPTLPDKETKRWMTCSGHIENYSLTNKPLLVLVYINFQISRLIPQQYQTNKGSLANVVLAVEVMAKPSSSRTIVLLARYVMSYMYWRTCLSDSLHSPDFLTQDYRKVRCT